MKRSDIRSSVRLAACLFLAVQLFGCSGGVENSEAGGVGEGGTGYVASSATGTVTGFGSVTGSGSVIVDGIRWDDRSARVETEIDPRQAPVPTKAQLGQRVSIRYQEAGRADVVSVEPEVRARISAINEASGALEFTAAGQTIRINTTAGAGPTTVFDGFELAAELRVDDRVEVHGAQRLDAATGVYSVAAARVQRIAELPAGYERVSGIVQALDATAQSIRIGRLTINTASATVLPSGRRLANGQRVTVWSRPAATAPTVFADVIRIRDDTLFDATEVRLSGYIGRLDDSRFDLGGTRVDAGNAAITPAGARLDDDAYVLVTGMQQANGTVIASSIEVRSGSTRAQYVDISGPVSGYVNIERFYVHGVRIVANDVPMLVNCPNNRIGNGSFVNVIGFIDGSKVVAAQLQCTNGTVSTATSVSGVAEQVSQSSRTFVLTRPGQAPRAVFWGSMTKFDDVSPETLNGKGVEVTGVLDAASGRVLAVQIKRP